MLTSALQITVQYTTVQYTDVGLKTVYLLLTLGRWKWQRYILVGIKLEQKVSERLLSANHIHFMFQIWYFFFLFCVLSTELTVRNHLFRNVTINVTPQDLQVETELYSYRSMHRKSLT